MKIILKYTFIILFLSLSLIIFFFGETTEGLQLGLKFIIPLISPDLQINSATGTLFSDFTLNNITYKSSEANVSVQSIHLNYDFHALLKAKIHIYDLTIGNTTISLLSNQKPTTPKKSFNKPNFSLLNSLSIDNFIITQLAVNYNNFTLQLRGNINNQWDCQWQIHAPNLTTLNPNAKGIVESKGTITGPRFNPIIDATLTGGRLHYTDTSINSVLAHLRISVKPNTDSLFSLKIAGLRSDSYALKHISLQVNGSVIPKPNSLMSVVHIQLNNKPFFSMQLLLPQSKGKWSANNSILGKGEFILTDLSLLSTFAPLIKQPAGTLKAKINVTGTLKQPHLEATLALTNASALLPDIGIKPQRINITAILQADKQFLFKGNFYIAKAEGHVMGLIDCSKANYPITLTLTGNRLPLINLSEYKITATPSINLSYENSILTLKGTVIIPEAKIIPEDFNDTVTLPDEVEFVGDKDLSSVLNLALNIQLSLGDNVYITDKNLDARLIGHLQINKDPLGPMIASGSLSTVNGTYKAYQKMLSIQTGHLQYAGNLITNPGLNIRAVKQFNSVGMESTSTFTNQIGNTQIYTGNEKITVGVAVTGTANHPQISLFSDPAGLSQSDIISYLLLGYPQSQATGNQGMALLGVLSSLNPNTNTAGFTDKLQKTLGLTELQVESVQTFDPTTQSAVSTTSFVVGKQISRNLSLHYSIGLFNPISILSLRYQLSQRWALQSETSAIDTGGDLLFTLERE